MTVKEAIAELSKYPETMDVFVAGGKTDFEFGLLNTVRKQKVRFYEDADNDDDIEAYTDCVILDEE